MGDLNDLEEKIKRFKSRDKPLAEEEDQQTADRNTGMKAGSEFITYVFSGALVGWLIGSFFGYLAFWLIVMMFAGFGMGIYRAAKIMK